MASFILSPAAEQDLLDIWGYTYETWGMKQADNYLDQLEVACHKDSSWHSFLGSSGHIMLNYQLYAKIIKLFFEN